MLPHKTTYITIAPYLAHYQNQETDMLEGFYYSSLCIYLKKKKSLRLESTINFTENTRVFKLESSAYTSILFI